MDVDAGLGIQGGPLVPVAFVRFLVRGIYGGASVDTEPKLNVIRAKSVVGTQKCVVSVCVQCCAWMCGAGRACV